MWSDTDYTFQDPGDGSWRSDNMLGGRVAGGRWRMRYASDFDRIRDFREYAWLGVRDDTLVLLGQQRTQIHPILNSLDFTGAQVGWTNQPLELFQPGPEPRELLPRQLQPISTFRGPGPPGGVAELRIDGITVARRNIGLDGTYEFLDVPLGTRQTSRIEVLVFDRSNLQIPVAVYEEQVSASQYLLGEHARMFLAGAGAQGNVLQDHIDGVSRRRTAPPASCNGGRRCRATSPSRPPPSGAWTPPRAWPASLLGSVREPSPRSGSVSPIGRFPRLRRHLRELPRPVAAARPSRYLRLAISRTTPHATAITTWSSAMRWTCDSTPSWSASAALGRRARAVPLAGTALAALPWRQPLRTSRRRWRLHPGRLRACCPTATPSPPAFAARPPWSTVSPPRTTPSSPSAAAPAAGTRPLLGDLQLAEHGDLADPGGGRRPCSPTAGTATRPAFVGPCAQV